MKFYATFPLKYLAKGLHGTLEHFQSHPLGNSYWEFEADNLTHARNHAVATIGYTFAFVYEAAEWDMIMEGEDFKLERIEL